MSTELRSEVRATPRTDHGREVRKAAALEPLEGRVLLSGGTSLVYEEGPNIGQPYSGGPICTLSHQGSVLATVHQSGMITKKPEVTAEGGLRLITGYVDPEA